MAFDEEGSISPVLKQNGRQLVRVKLFQRKNGRFPGSDYLLSF
jgi:hypothetical protein